MPAGEERRRVVYGIDHGNYMVETFTTQVTWSAPSSVIWLQTVYMGIKLKANSTYNILQDVVSMFSCNFVDELDTKPLLSGEQQTMLNVFLTN